MRMNLEGGRKWAVAADLGNINQICLELAAWLSEHNLAEQLFAVELLAREALNNAVLHGCDGDPDQLVDFEIQFSGKTLCLIIQDAGPGFDWRAIMREDLVDEEKVNGRGLRIYSRYADRVVFNEPGNCVKLYRYLPGNEDGEQPRAGNSEPERNGK